MYWFADDVDQNEDTHEKAHDVICSQCRRELAKKMVTLYANQIAIVRHEVHQFIETLWNIDKKRATIWESNLDIFEKKLVDGDTPNTVSEKLSLSCIEGFLGSQAWLRQGTEAYPSYWQAMEFVQNMATSKR